MEGQGQSFGQQKCAGCNFMRLTLPFVASLDVKLACVMLRAPSLCGWSSLVFMGRGFLPGKKQGPFLLAIAPPCFEVQK